MKKFQDTMFLILFLLSMLKDCNTKLSNIKIYNPIKTKILDLLDTDKILAAGIYCKKGSSLFQRRINIDKKTVLDLYKGIKSQEELDKIKSVKIDDEEYNQIKLDLPDTIISLISTRDPKNYLLVTVTDEYIIITLSRTSKIEKRECETWLKNELKEFYNQS